VPEYPPLGERPGGISERYVLHYCQAFGISPQAFGPVPAPGDESVTGRTPVSLRQAGPVMPAGDLGPAEIGDRDRRELLRVFGMARVVLAAREFLAATAEMVSPDTPHDELLRHLTHYRAHLSALAAGGTAPASSRREACKESTRS